MNSGKSRSRSKAKKKDTSKRRTHKRKRTYDELITCKLDLERAQAKFSAVSNELHQAVENGEISDKSFQNATHKVSFTDDGERAQSLSFAMLTPLVKSWFRENGMGSTESAENASGLVAYVKDKRPRVPTKGGFRITKLKPKT